MTRRLSTAPEKEAADVPAPAARALAAAVEPLAYSMEDAGKALGGVTTKTLYRWVRDGKLRTTKVGGRTLVRRVELERILAEGETKAAA